jgi:hypothetical protein
LNTVSQFQRKYSPETPRAPSLVFFIFAAERAEKIKSCHKGKGVWAKAVQ